MVSRQHSLKEVSSTIQSEVTAATVNHETRSKIANEILETERSYVSSLEIIVKSYLHPLNAVEGLRTKIKLIFGNIETILGINQDLFARLSERISTWDESTCVGDIFRDVGPFLKMYTVYSNQYNEATKLMHAMLAEDPQFAEEVERINNERLASAPNALRLEHMLIMPIQRIPRYNLLLTDLIKKTPPEHVDYDNLIRALQVTKEVADHINKCVAQSENFKKIGNTGFKGLVEAHRRLLHEGVLPIQQSATTVGDSDSRRFGFLSTGETQKFHFYLFNDRLVFAPEKDVGKQKDISKTEMNWPLYLVWIQPGKDDSFRIIGPNRAFFVHASAEERAKWFPIMNDAVSAVLTESRQDPIRRTGSFEFLDGSSYEGSWYEGRLAGQGIYSFSGNVYDGNWQDSQKEGMGVLTCTTGDVYEGHWTDNLPEGEGQVRYRDGGTYVGHFSKGLFHETGTLTWPNKDFYQGTFNNDLFAGSGSMFLSEGSSYAGEFREGAFHGFGTLTLKDGLVYKGNWKNGHRSGSGTQTSSAGTYEGEWADNLNHGKGKFSGAAGTYEGQWSGGRMEGKGTLTTAAGTQYLGKWKNGLPHGKGEMRYASGDTYTGTWRDGKYSGNGVLSKPNGVKLEGAWEEGKLVGKFSILSSSQPIRGVVKGSDTFCQVPACPGPVFCDVAPELPRFEAAQSFLVMFD